MSAATITAPAGRAAPRQSLSVRLLVLVGSVLLLVELLLLIPGLQRERHLWLAERLRTAEIVSLAVDGGIEGPQRLLTLQRTARLADLWVIGQDTGAGLRPILVPLAPLAVSRSIDLDREDWSLGLRRAADLLLLPHGQWMQVAGTGTLGTKLVLVVPQAPLAHGLRAFAARFALIALAITTVTGALLFVALRAMLVVPLRRVARNIAAFRINPERGVPLDAERVSAVHGDEITQVGRELSAMQAELRTALWRNARLAAVGTAVAKMSHDLRGTLASSLLVADRLTMHAEPRVRDAGEVIVRSVHRATALAQDTLDFVRQGPPPLARTRVVLHTLINEAATTTDESERACLLDNRIDPALEASVDRDSMLRVATNLWRNAVQAGARRVVVEASGTEPAIVLTLEDDGPGLPAAVRERLFAPFVTSRSGGTGLGLAIARDLMRAHGGDLQLASSGPEGTRFKLYLQQPGREPG